MVNVLVAIMAIIVVVVTVDVVLFLSSLIDLHRRRKADKRAKNEK